MGRSDRIGGMLLGAGALLLGLIHLAIAVYVPNVETKMPVADLIEVLTAIHALVPYVVSIVFMLAGLYMIFIIKSEAIDKDTWTQMQSVDK